MASKIESIKKIYPKDFFNISQPDTPIVQIQVRTKIAEGRIDNIDDWEEVHLEPGKNNYFDSMSIEDNGGLQRVTFSVFDKNFAEVENAIIRSLVATKAANEMAETVIIPDDSTYFNFTMDAEVGTNIRIRFGYSDIGDFIDEVDFNEAEFADRTGSEKTVVRSPWIYLQMIGTKFSLKPEGLRVEVTAFSVFDSFLSRAKLLRRFATLEGTPKDVLTTLGTIIRTAAGGEDHFEFVFEEDDPKSPITGDQTEEAGFIKINLGSEVHETKHSLRSMRSVFSSVMSKIPPKYYKEDDTETMSEITEPDEQEKATKIVHYRYFISQSVPTDGKTIKTTMTFKYPDPINVTQGKVRTYIWKEYGQSIVKNLNIDSRVDFASLNTQIFSRSSDEISLVIGTPSTSEETNDSESDTRTHIIADVTKTLNKNNFDYTFVSNTIDYNESSHDGPIGEIVAANIIHNLNQGVFEGTIEIPGDPFYLFDKNLSPIQFLIKIIVLRPGYIDSSNEYKPVSVSYLSGFYGVSKINHVINSSGFSTALEIVRWPIEG